MLKFEISGPDDFEDKLRSIIREELQSVRESEAAKDDILLTKEAAEYLQVSVPTLRNMITAREVPFFQRGQVIRFSRQALNAWIRGNAQ